MRVHVHCDTHDVLNSVRRDINFANLYFSLEASVSSVNTKRMVLISTKTENVQNVTHVLTLIREMVIILAGYINISSYFLSIDEASCFQVFLILDCLWKEI